jgi:hypothetical protein
VKRFVLSLAALAVSMLLITGCAGTSQPTHKPNSKSGPVPEFTGPWANEFRDAYQDATTKFERTVLEDENISDQELSEMRSKLKQCLVSSGFSDIHFSDGGELQFSQPSSLSSEQVNERAQDCSASSGEDSIGALYSWIRRNPKNLDEDKIMAECLVRKKVVDRSYSAKDYKNDSPTQSFPFIKSGGSAAFDQCVADPLGLFE